MSRLGMHGRAGQSLATASGLLGALQGGRRPKAWGPLSAVLALLALLALPLLTQCLGQAWVRILDTALLYVMLAVGLNVVVGFAGLLDLGYIAFYALGAYVYALLASPHLHANLPELAQWLPWTSAWSVWAVLPVAALAAAAAGVLLGAPTLKLRGDYLAIVTLGFGEIIRVFLNNLDAPYNLTNGPKGIDGIEPIHLGPWNLGQAHHLQLPASLGAWQLELSPVVQYCYVFMALAALVGLMSVRLHDSRLGRAWIAIREDESAAKAMGLRTRDFKLLAFAIGASVGGIAGVMFSAFQGFVSPESFSLPESVLIVAMVVLGGVGHTPGVMLGAFLLAALPEVLRLFGGPLQELSGGHIDVVILRQLLVALAMIGVVLVRPRGLWPSPRMEDRWSNDAPAAAGAADASAGDALP